MRKLLWAPNARGLLLTQAAAMMLCPPRGNEQHDSKASSAANSQRQAAQSELASDEPTSDIKLLGALINRTAPEKLTLQEMLTVLQAVNEASAELVMAGLSAYFRPFLVQAPVSEVRYALHMPSAWPLHCGFDDVMPHVASCYRLLALLQSAGAVRDV